MSSSMLPILSNAPFLRSSGCTDYPIITVSSWPPPPIFLPLLIEPPSPPMILSSSSSDPFFSNYVSDLSLCYANISLDMLRSDDVWSELAPPWSIIVSFPFYAIPPPFLPRSLFIWSKVIIVVISWGFILLYSSSTKPPWLSKDSSELVSSRDYQTSAGYWYSYWIWSDPFSEAESGKTDALFPGWTCPLSITILWLIRKFYYKYL